MVTRVCAAVRHPERERSHGTPSPRAYHIPVPATSQPPKEQRARNMATERRRFTRQEIRARNSRENAAIIINNIVYDITAFLDQHPGGAAELLAVAGRDASFNFHEAVHSGDAVLLRNQFVVGEVVDEDHESPMFIHWTEGVGAEDYVFPPRPGPGWEHYVCRLILVGILFLSSLIFLAALYENIFRNMKLFRYLKYKERAI